jgi:serine/threonine protein kinase
VKSFNHAAYGDTDAGTRILHERALLELVNCRGGHPFVVGFRFAIVDSTFAYLAMDNVGGGDMYSLLQRHGPFPPRAARVYVAEVVLALAHLHSFDVVHRDVKVPCDAAPNAPSPQRARRAPFRSFPLLTTRVHPPVPLRSILPFLSPPRRAPCAARRRPATPHTGRPTPPLSNTPRPAPGRARRPHVLPSLVTSPRPSPLVRAHAA